jgi:hypothetical protein
VNVPERRRLTREDVEAVIRRAARIEAELGEEGPELTEADLIRIASEVGLSEESVRRALAEHFVGSPGAGLLSDRGWASRLCGPGLVGASRIIQRAADEAREELESHFVKRESLRLVRRLEAGSLWEPERGVVASIVRSVDFFGHGYHLAKARALHLRVVPLGERRSQVWLTADLANERAGWFWGMGMGAGLPGAVLFGIAAGVTDLVALGVASPLWWGGALWVARAGYLKALRRLQIGLEGLLDRLEHGEPLEPTRPSWRELLG